MLKICKWDKIHLFDPRGKHCCDFLCKKCYLEVYLTYASLFTIDEFEENIDFIKRQKNLILSKDLSEADKSICQMLGEDTLVKINLFEQMYG